MYIPGGMQQLGYVDQTTVTPGDAIPLRESECALGERDAGASGTVVTESLIDSIGVKLKGGWGGNTVK